MKTLFCIAAFLFSAPIFAAPFSYTQLILYKSGATYLPAPTAASWQKPSNAYTAITIPMPFDVWKAQGVVVSSASVQIVWKANSLYANTSAAIMACPAQTGGGFTGCSLLVYFAANDTDGPASYTPGCSANPGGPMPCRADVTSILNQYIQGGTPYYFAIASYGNGSAGPMIWDVEILVIN